MATTTEADAMRRAVELSARALGATAPNPVVGAVVLDAAGVVVGEGWHRRAGGPHAEVHALAAAGARARGGTAVVTLEPCNHTGRTGPCAQALIDAGIARVVYAVADPTPKAAGGAQALRAAGIDVESGLLADEAAAVNVAWLTCMRLGRPYVRWKYAATLDGRIAAADGTSRWISSAESRADVHRLRAEADAVVVGSGTLVADDPHLAVRGIDGVTQPLRVVVDTRARITSAAPVLDDAAATLVAVGADADTSHLPGVDVVRLPYAAVGAAAGDGDAPPGSGPGPARGLDIPALLVELAARGVRSVLLEGGPTLAGAFLAAGAVDEVVAYLAPALLGAGPAALTETGVTTLARALRFEVTEVARVGPDVRITAAPAPAAEPASATVTASQGS